MAAAQQFIRNFLAKFSKDQTTTLAASLAFYTALSLAPLVILFVTISSQFSLELQNNFVSEAEFVVGSEGAAAFDMIIESAKTRPDLTSIASLVGVLTLLLSASMIFGELRNALNRIFEVAPRAAPKPGYFRKAWAVAREHILHVGFALCFILILILSLAASSIINAAESNTNSAAAVINIVLSLISYVILFALTFRYLPDRRQPWRRAIRGGALTAVLVVFGTEIIGLYLGNTAIGSAYGAAGSVIVLLVWVYYSTLITFVGAQVSALLIPIRRKRRPA
jgi:membrane protein